jgi:hypothetical protein
LTLGIACTGQADRAESDRHGLEPKYKADSDCQPAVYLVGRWLEGNPAAEFSFAQIAKPCARHKEMAASLVTTTRSVGQLRGALVRIAQVARQIVVSYERFGPDEPWGFADPGAGSAAHATARRERAAPAAAGSEHAYVHGKIGESMTDWLEGEHDGLDLGERRWPLAPTDLLPRERWPWWEQLWSDVLMLGNRYRIQPGKDWWEDGQQVEALAALAPWVRLGRGDWQIKSPMSRLRRDGWTRPRTALNAGSRGSPLHDARRPRAGRPLR